VRNPLEKQTACRPVICAGEATRIPASPAPLSMAGQASLYLAPGRPRGQASPRRGYVVLVRHMKRSTDISSCMALQGLAAGLVLVLTRCLELTMQHITHKRARKSPSVVFPWQKSPICAWPRPAFLQDNEVRALKAV
jgi:hypothetical protein